MTSVALHTWTTEARSALDEILAAHRAVGGSAPGRRYATREINHAYAVLLSSRFQRFCRDLHTEAIELLAGAVSSPTIADLLRARMLEARKLDRGNPNSGNLGSDFGRLGIALWQEVSAMDARNGRRRELLGDLTAWRNAVAHQDFTSTTLRPKRLGLQDVNRWRTALDALARSFDLAVSDHLLSLVGTRPW